VSSPNKVKKEGCDPRMAEGRQSNPRSLMTLAEVLEELQVAKSTFYDWLAKGRGPRCIKLPNGQIRVRRSEFERWLGALPERD
jgi:predicted DNA-binding transcriptional regulator AlpA